ncbi:30S ribosomal protein S4 [Candidatus Falkowbacteria bacterium]|nr:30S ribosomal protein S4 [Candidatus Falkowbacteria bacterium]
MARDLDPKCKQCRRAGEKLFLKGERCDTPKCAMIKRNYPPGAHGSKRKPRLSEYGLQLREKQKAKKSYRILEKQFKNYFVKASMMKGDVGYNFLNLLEHRLDNVIYKANLMDSKDSARQAISHGLVLLNGKKMSIPSYIVKIGDTIGAKEESILAKKIEEFNKSKNKDEVPSWLAYDSEKKEIKAVGNLGEDDLPRNIDIRLIVEYYSK